MRFRLLAPRPDTMTLLHTYGKFAPLNRALRTHRVAPLLITLQLILLCLLVHP